MVAGPLAAFNNWCFKCIISLLILTNKIVFFIIQLSLFYEYYDHSNEFKDNIPGCVLWQLFISM